MGIANKHGLFQFSVNVQSKYCPHLRLLFAVAKLGNPSYCWDALRDVMVPSAQTFYPAEADVP
jgi:hypothetical protein